MYFTCFESFGGVDLSYITCLEGPWSSVLPLMMRQSAALLGRRVDAADCRSPGGSVAAGSRTFQTFFHGGLQLVYSERLAKHIKVIVFCNISSEIDSVSSFFRDPCKSIEIILFWKV